MWLDKGANGLQREQTDFRLNRQDVECGVLRSETPRGRAVGDGLHLSDDVHYVRSRGRLAPLVGRSDTVL